MKLAVSSIAWTNEEETEVAELLRSLGVKYVELAPTKRWNDPTTAPKTELRAYKEFWAKYDIEVVAFQSMLFNQPDLTIFHDQQTRTRTLHYLQEFIRVAAEMGAKVMVFGSPKNRQHGTLGNDETLAIGHDFFYKLGETAKNLGVQFCIEPNPTAYACDFITNAQEGVEFVKLVNSTGFGLHLDIAGMTLAEDNIEQSIKTAAPLLKHFHISSPYLEQVEERPDVQHMLAAQSLRDIGYKNFVSIEMRPAAVGENVARVKQAVMFAQATYAE